jgi:periplasmic protein TonB
VRPLSAPFAASIAGHAGLLAGMLLFAAQLPPLPLPQPRAVEIEVAVLPPPPIPEAFPATPPPPEPEPPPIAKAEPPPIPEPEPPAVTAEPPPPPPPPKRVVHKPPPPPHRPPPRIIREEALEPMYRPPIAPAMPQPLPPQAPPMQTAAMPVPRPAPAPAGPVVSPGYRTALSAWLESHKRYPDSARSRGEEGRAVLHFRVDRSGRLLNFAVAQSTGYPDLDAAINDMMRGASLPPFPADMTASDVEVTVTIRFGLTR